MLKILFKVAILIVFAQDLFAQESYQIFKFSSNAIVATKNVPEGFKLFVPDSASQVLINPARGVFSSNFYYATYYPASRVERGSLAERPIYSISYFNKNSLFRLETSPQYNEDSSTLFNELEENLSVTEQDNLVKNKDLNVKISITDIGETKNFRYAIGFTGIVGNSQINRLFNLQSKRSSIFQSSENTQLILESNNNKENDYKDSNKGFLLGVNFSMAGQDWDLINTVNFQELNINRKLESRAFQSRERPVTSGAETSIFLQSSDIYDKLQIEQSPSIFNLSSYLRKRNVFLNMNLSYSFDAKLDYSLTSTETSRETPEQNEPEIIKSISESGIISPKFFESQFAVGYVFSKQKQKLDLFAGVSPEVSYQFWRNVTDQDLSLESKPLVFEKSEFLQVSIVTPLYLKYNTNVGLSISGGLNYFTSFAYLKNSSKNIESTQALKAAFESKITTKNFSTSKNLYLGLSMKHNSGLIAHVDFNGDLSRLNIWNLSLGYHF